MQELLQKALVESKGQFSDAVISKVECLTGGCIHKAWKLQLSDGVQLFAKTTSAKNFESLSVEAKGLTYLKRFADPDFIAIPEPLILNHINNNSILIMPWLDLTTGDQTILGKGLALLHKASSENNPDQFGYEIDGFIGLGPQPGGWRKSWGECFVHLRLIPQLKIATKWGLCLSDWEELFDDLIKLLEAHKPIPSLVHGDLWSGNAALQANGKAVIFDPAVCWADREVDLAMTKLFGGFSHDFYKGYENIWPLPINSESRSEIYNLYHLLNHANLFGGSYQNQSLSVLKNLKNMFLN